MTYEEISDGLSCRFYTHHNFTKRNIGCNSKPVPLYSTLLNSLRFYPYHDLMIPFKTAYFTREAVFLDFVFSIIFFL